MGKHIPIRTCVACRTRRPKRELIRVVRTPEGQVQVDPTGKAKGRGAYLCPQVPCWERVLQRHTILAHALKGPVPAEALEELRKFMVTQLSR
ncbi:MAG: YlxR family protein [Ardenticatenia bacterium]|nr:YlxR family protein [Ardenticatenia bacterium]